MKKIFTIYVLFVCLHVSAQTSLTIPQIQGSGNMSSYVGTSVTTTGIVTAKYFGTGKIGGFFLQDATGDGNTNTSDGIFVSTITDNVSVGNKIEIVATVNEYNGRTQLINPTSISILATNQTLPITKVVYDPVMFTWEKYEGMLLEFDQTLYVNSNRNLQRYGELELGDVRKPSPTNVAFPGSAEYDAQVNRNSLTPIYLDDAVTTSYYTPIVFADANGTRRTGERVKNLQAVVDYNGSKYVIYPAMFPVNFFGNPRPTSPSDLGNYNLKVCGFNLEYYLTIPNSTGMGPATQTDMDNQHTKIVAALKAIDADIYGLVEIEQGQDALTKLANSLTSSTGKPYSYINDGTSISGTYTKSAYLYRTDKVSPYLLLKSINSPGPTNRKKQQAFTLKSNNERFIFSINHFKAKSGCGSASGNDADQGDGQSCYNATRTAEANSVMQYAVTNTSYYGDPDVLVMGDLNAYAKEDPIQAFINDGYTDLHQKFHPDTSYSYVFNGETGYLDHALANESMSKQITGISVFHINSDEPTMFEYNQSTYQPNMYRCSDHDPVVVGVKLDAKSNNDIPYEDKVKLYPSIATDYLTIENAGIGFIQIYSFSGVKMYETNIKNDKEIISIKEAGLLSGAYIVKILGNASIARRIILVK